MMMKNIGYVLLITDLLAAAEERDVDMVKVTPGVSGSAPTLVPPTFSPCADSCVTHAPGRDITNLPSVTDKTNCSETTSV